MQCRMNTFNYKLCVKDTTQIQNYYPRDSNYQQYFSTVVLYNVYVVIMSCTRLSFWFGFW